MKRWKYDARKIASNHDSEETKKTLNRLGDQGWELVQVIEPYYYLKQEQK
jgi:Domain of unknown function (DUF4177)